MTLRKLGQMVGKVSVPHPYAWLWEPLESDPRFVLRSLFSGKAAYLDGRLALSFVAREEPWKGVLVCTYREHHASLMAEIPELSPHPFLSKWLYLPERADRFETIAVRLVKMAKQRDPRLGVEPKPRKKPRRDFRP